MFRDSTIIEIHDDFVIKHVSGLKGRLTNSEGTNYYVELLDDAKASLKIKRAVFVLDGVDINIKTITLPKLKKKVLNDLIKNELLYYFKDLDSIVFRYSVFKEYNNKQDILVFCIDKRRINLALRYMNNNVKLRGVYLIQFCFLNCFKAKLKDKNYIFMFVHREKLYLLYVVENKLFNCVIHKCAPIDNNAKNHLNNFMESCHMLYETEINTVYMANFSEEEVYKCKLEKINMINLGRINARKLVKDLA